MTHYSRKVKCPYCNTWIDKQSTWNPQGSPFRICPRCRREYFDKDYQENAIWFLTREQSAFFVDICAAFMLLVTIGVLYAFYDEKSLSLSVIVIEVALVAITVVLTRYAIKQTIRFSKNNKNDLYMERIAYLKLPSSEQQHDIADSLNRLSNRQYLDRLTSCGVEIPDFFFDRIGYYEGKRHYQQTQQIIEEKLDSDFQKLMKAQSNWRASKNLLSLGKNSSEFKKVAKDCNMTPDEFERYCKKCIDDYDEIHRQYNLTHDEAVAYPRV